MTIKLGQEETKFNKENLIKENDTRFSEIIDFLKKDCKAEFINGKWIWTGNYEVKGKDKFTYILNTFRLNKNNEEEFEIIVSSKNIKMYFYFTKDELINKFFSATKTLSLIVELKDIEERTENYVTPSEAQIKNDIANFMKAISIPVSSEVPTGDGALSFFYALNY